MKDKTKKFLSSPLLKKLLLAGAVTAGATAAAVAVKKIKENGLPTKSRQCIPKAKNVYITANSVSALAAAAYLIKDGGYDASSVHVYGSPANSAFNEDYGSIGTHFMSLMKEISAASDDGLDICDIIENATFAPEPTVKTVDNAGNVRMLDIAPSHTVLKAINKAIRNLRDNELDEMSIREYFASHGELFDSDLFAFIEMTFGLRDEHKASEFAKRAEQVLVSSPQTGFYDTLYYEFSAVDALTAYLKNNGVDLHENAQVTGLDINDGFANAIHLTDDGTRMTIYLNRDDYVFFSAGNIGDNRSEGSGGECAEVIEAVPPSLPLWSKLATNSDNFGLPELILADCAELTEVSVVDNNGYLTNKLCELTNSVAEHGISLLLTQSNWHMKVTAEPITVLDGDTDTALNNATSGTDGENVCDLTDEDIKAARELAAQPVTPCINIKGVYCDIVGCYVDKTMRECSGKEVLYELCSYLGIIDDWDNISKNTSVAMTVNYPYKTAPYATAREHTLPEMHPCENCYCIGSFTKTNAPSGSLEQEVLSAKKAVYDLLGIKKKI